VVWFDSAEQPIGSASDLWRSLPRTLQKVPLQPFVRGKELAKLREAAYRSLRPNIFSALLKGQLRPCLVRSGDERSHRVQGAVALLDREIGDMASCMAVRLSPEIDETVPPWGDLLQDLVFCET